MTKKMIFGDRYTALGIDYPKEETVCHGQCEGTGWVPVYQELNHGLLSIQQAIDNQSEDKRLISLWHDAHKNSHNVGVVLKQAFDFLIMKKPWWAIKHVFTGHRCDGWHFVKCPDCGGTGKRI